MSGFVQRLRQRKIVQWGVAYAAGGWGLLQVLDFLRENFAVPVLIVQSSTWLLAVGLFAVIVVAWYHGEKGQQRVSGTELLILTMLVAIAGIGLPFVTARAPGTSSGGIGERSVIAVLPFDNFSPSPDDAYLANGLTEEITNQLAKIGELRVLSRVAITRALASELSLAEISRTLGVGSVLEGSVQVSGESLRITATLIDAATNEHLWSDGFDRSLSDLFALQTEVALAIAAALEAELTPQEQTDIQNVGTQNAAAYSAYLRSRELPGGQPATNRSAIVLLQQALALDASFSGAWSRLSWRYVWEARMGSLTAPDSAIALARHALDLTPRSAEAHYALASAYWTLGRVEDAFSSWEDALQIDPEHVSSLLDLSAHEVLAGRLASSLGHALRAVALVPNVPNIRWHLWIPLHRLNDHERTGAWLDRAEGDGLEHARLEQSWMTLALQNGELEAASDRAFALLADYPGRPEQELLASELLAWTGRFGSARGVLEQHVRLAPDRLDPWSLGARSWRATLAYLLHELGDTAQAAEMFQASLEARQAAIDAGNELSVHPREIAAIHAFRGEHEQAIEWLERAWEASYPDGAFLGDDPMFISIREDGRFRSLLDRMAAHVAAESARAVADGSIAAIDSIIGGADPQRFRGGR